jgi:hypothetical protein
MLFRSKRSREAAAALTAAQEALENLAKSTAALNDAGRRAGQALSGMASVTARAEAALVQARDARQAAEGAPAPTTPETPPEQRPT